VISNVNSTALLTLLWLPADPAHVLYMEQLPK